MGNLHVRFLEGWAPAMAPGYSTLIDKVRLVRYPGTIRDTNIRFQLHTSPGTWFRRQGLSADTQRADSPGWVNPRKRNKAQGQEARCGTEVPQER